MKRKFLSALLATAFMAVSFAAHAEPVKLRYKFKAGDISKFKVSYKVHLDMKVAGVPEGAIPATYDVAFNGIATQKILGVLPDGSAKILTKYTSCEMSMTGFPSQKIPVDSMPSITMKLSPDGKFSGFEDLDKKASLKSRFSNPAVQKYINMIQEQAQPKFPDEPVDVGSTWQRSAALPFNDNPLVVNSTIVSMTDKYASYTAANIKHDFKYGIDVPKLVDFITGFLPAEAKSDPKFGAVTAAINGAIDTSGTFSFLFSQKAGKLLRANGDVLAVVDVSLPAEQMGPNAPSKIDVKANITFNMNKI